MAVWRALKSRVFNAGSGRYPRKSRFKLLMSKICILPWKTEEIISDKESILLKLLSVPKFAVRAIMACLCCVSCYLQYLCFRTIDSILVFSFSSGLSSCFREMLLTTKALSQEFNWFMVIFWTFQASPSERLLRTSKEVGSRATGPSESHDISFASECTAIYQGNLTEVFPVQSSDKICFFYKEFPGNFKKIFNQIKLFFPCAYIFKWNSFFVVTLDFKIYMWAYWNFHKYTIALLYF